MGMFEEYYNGYGMSSDMWSVASYGVKDKEETETLKILQKNIQKAFYKTKTQLWNIAGIEIEYSKIIGTIRRQVPVPKEEHTVTYPKVTFDLKKGEISSVYPTINLLNREDVQEMIEVFEEQYEEMKEKLKL